MTAKKLLIVSTSTVHGQPYLSYMTDEIQTHFMGVKSIIFIPFARPGGITWDAYTAIAQKFFNSIGIQVKGIHEFSDPIAAIESAEGFFTGGGNTFVLLKELYESGILASLKSAVEKGTPYMGTSAGSKITGKTVNNTNDMPIVYPPSFDALGLVPFNINPHYLDPDPSSTHMGETRETRIKEFHTYHNIRVAGLREGSYLRLFNGKLELGGPLSMRLFEQNKAPREIAPGLDLQFMLDSQN